jgi:MFS family permease
VGLNNNRRVTLTLYLIAVLLFWGGQYIYLSTLPTYAQTKVSDLSAVGFILSMYGLWQALIRIPVGIASDWLGRRKIFIIGGFALSGVGAWIMATSNDALGLAIGRATTGAATGAWVVIIVAVSALFPPEEAVRASSILMVFNSLGRILSTFSAGDLVDNSGYTFPFYAATVLGLLSAALLLPIQETRRPTQPPNLASIFRILVRRDVLAPSLLSAVGQYALWTSAFGFFTVLAKQLGATSISQGAIITIHITLAMIGSFLTSWRRLRITSSHWVYASFGLLASGIAIAAFAPSLTILLIAPIFTGLGMGIGYPVLMGMSIVKIQDSDRTMAMSLHQTIYAIGMFIGPASSGAIADAIGLQPMFAITAGGTLVLGLTGMRLSERLMAKK